MAAPRDPPSPCQRTGSGLPEKCPISHSNLSNRPEKSSKVLFSSCPFVLCFEIRVLRKFGVESLDVKTLVCCSTQVGELEFLL
ncbi:hypothetical protein RDI58_014713 [Solanum bulbocastanum]|uniref:Uncharacterized protein n=1 Tax=Solanum bulbocastanum TaxID=147425 RepID=A0AAN8TK55_SOLBU